MKESETRDEYQDLARQLKNMKVRMIQIIIGAIETVSKGLEKKRRSGYLKRNQDYPDHSSIEIS